MAEQMLPKGAGQKTPYTELALRRGLVGQLNEVIDKRIPSARNREEITAAIVEYKAKRKELIDSYKHTDPTQQSPSYVVSKIQERLATRMDAWLMGHDQAYRTESANATNSELLPLERRAAEDRLGIIVKGYGLDGIRKRRDLPSD